MRSLGADVAGAWVVNLQRTEDNIGALTLEDRTKLESDARVALEMEVRPKVEEIELVLGGREAVECHGV